MQTAGILRRRVSRPDGRRFCELTVVLYDVQGEVPLVCPERLTQSRRGGFAAAERAPKRDVYLPFCVTLTAKSLDLGDSTSTESKVKRECILRQDSLVLLETERFDLGVPQRAEAKCCPPSPGQRRNTHAQSRVAHVVETTSLLQLQLNSY